MYKAANGYYYIKPSFRDPKKINKDLYDELKNKFTGKQRYYADPEIIDSKMTRYDFLHRYYN